MPVFFYRALDAKGRAHEGVLDAESSANAREKLRNMGLYPAEVRDERNGAATAAPRRASLRRGALGAREVAGFTRQLATLLGTGVPLVPALSVLIRQSRREAVRRLLVRLREEVNEGESLANALESYPRDFSPMYVNMVRAGEASGALGDILSRLADHLDSQHALRRRLASAMAYPALMSVTGLGVLIFLLIFVVPNVVAIFQSARQELPWPTRVLLASSDFLENNWGWLLLAAGLLAAAAAAGLRTPAGRMFRDRLRLRIPWFGGLVQRAATARFVQTLGVLLSAGVPILNALSIAKLVIANAVLEAAVDQAMEETREGGSLSRALEKSGFFPPIVTDMAGVGEQTGRLDEMLQKVSEHLEREVNISVQTALSLVDPVLILVMGTAVGFVVLAILLPLFEVSQLAR